MRDNGSGHIQDTADSMLWPLRVGYSRFSAENPAAFALMAGALVLLSAWVGLVLTSHEGRIAAFWPANGLLVALLLPQAKRRWPLLLATGFAAYATANLVVGDIPLQAVTLAACNLIEVAIAVMFLRRRDKAVYDAGCIPEMLKFLAVGVLLAPAISGVLASACLHAIAGTPYLTTFLTWYPADVLGMALMTPLVLSFWILDFRQLLHSGKWAQSLPLMLLVVVTAGYIFYQNHYPFLFLIFPVLILVAFRTGFLGAMLSVFLVLLIAFAMTEHGHGPLWLQPNATLWSSIVLLQLYVFVLLLSIAPVAAALARQRAIDKQLYEEKTRYRLLADNSRDIVVLSDLEGRRLYVSPAVEDVLGWSPAEWTGVKSEDLMHPDDLPGFRTMLAEMLQGSERRAFSYRTRKKDDTYLWMEASLQLLRDEVTGEPNAYVANVRDISRRVAAEEKLDLAYRQMRQLATLDGLTSLSNRRRFDEVLEVEWRRAMRNHESIALLMLDIDHFKRVNDMYGHRAGDLCLQTVAMVIADCMRRPGDLAARYGGEEFAVILPNTDAEGARHLGELLREKIHNAQTDIGMGDPVVLTASVGIASRSPRMYERPDLLVEAADRALYDAKSAGRDRVLVFRSI